MSAYTVSIFDPTGNITALVEGPVAAEEQRAEAARIMGRCPAVEQVGFVRFPEEGGRVELRMAGGEFCGNASMSAAALSLLRRGSAAEEEQSVWVEVSGVDHAVEVRLRREEDGLFRAAVRMPPALEIAQTAFSFGAVNEKLPVVRMEGISHAVVTQGSAFFALLGDKNAAEAAAKRLCASLRADALGLMFLEGEGARRRLTPLVTVPGSGTVFWERSCASGSAAAAMALSACEGAPVRLELSEPGGVLTAESDPHSGETWLRGTTRLAAQGS